MDKKKILIVEDDEMILSMYKTKLEADGYEIITANTGFSGLETAKKEKVDLILLDIMLPLMDGFTVLQELKKDAKTKNTLVVMLTNLGTDEDKEKGEKMGARDYLVKAAMTPSQVSENIKKYFK